MDWFFFDMSFVFDCLLCYWNVMSFYLLNLLYGLNGNFFGDLFYYWFLYGYWYLIYFYFVLVSEYLVGYLLGDCVIFVLSNFNWFLLGNCLRYVGCLWYLLGYVVGYVCGLYLVSFWGLCWNLMKVMMLIYS